MQQSVHPMAWFENGWSKHDDDNDPKYSNKLFNSFHLIHTQKYSQQLHCFILFRYFSTALSTGLSKQVENKKITIQKNSITIGKDKNTKTPTSNTGNIKTESYPGH